MLGKISATWGRAKLITMRATMVQTLLPAASWYHSSAFPQRADSARSAPIVHAGLLWPVGPPLAPQTPVLKAADAQQMPCTHPSCAAAEGPNTSPVESEILNAGAVSEGHWDSHLSRTKERTWSLKLKHFPTPGDKPHTGCIPGKEYSRPKAHSCVSEQGGGTVAMGLPFLTIMCDMPPLQSYLRLLYR